MEEEKIESANNLEVAEQEEVVESTTNNEVVEQQGENQEETTTKESDNSQTQETQDNTQTAEDNSAARLARIRAEKEAEGKIEKARQEGYEQGLKQGQVQEYIGKENPYTNQKINDEYDVQEYLDMYKLDSQGKEPISAYRELQKQRVREEAEQKVKVEEEQKQNEWYKKDTQDFLDKYSTEKLQELSKDEDFNLFANGKIGKVPLANIYEDYQKLIGKYEKKSVETAKQIVANNNTTPGAIEEGATQELDWNSMSNEEFEKYIQRAKDGELK